MTLAVPGWGNDGRKDLSFHYQNAPFVLPSCPICISLLVSPPPSRRSLQFRGQEKRFTQPQSDIALTPLSVPDIAMADPKDGHISRARYLPRLSIDSSSRYSRSSFSSLSSFSSSTRASFAPSFTTMSSDSDGLFFVLCLFDFDTEDPDQLSFRSDEVLQVIKTEESVSIDSHFHHTPHGND